MSGFIQATSAGPGRDEIASMVQTLLIEQAIVAQAFSNKSAFAAPGDKSVSFPKYDNNFDVQKLSGSQKGDDQEIVISLDQLDLDIEAHVQWVIKKFDQLRSRVSVLETSVRNATASHARQLDRDILNELIPNITLTDVTGGVIQDNIPNMMTTLNNAFVPQENRTFIFGNASYGDLLKIDGFIDASKSNLDIVRNGQIGTLYGIPVLRSDVLDTVDGGATLGLLVHMESLAYAFGANPAIEDEKVISLGTGSRRWVMDALRGQKTLQNGQLAVRLTA
jgi:hypothetical protein